MATRATVFQKTQLGVEVTPGTLVGANKQLQATEISISPNIPGTPFRPMGSKYNTAMIVGKEMSTGRIRGTLAYNDLIYLLSGVLEKGASGTFKVATFNVDDIQTYTFEFGADAATGAEKMGYGIINSLSINIDRDSATVEGDVIGRALTGGITPTAAPTKIKAVPVAPKSIDVLVGDDVAGLTKLSRCLRAAVNIGNRFTPLMTLDSAQPSFTDHVERAPDLTASITVEANSVEAGFLNDLRNAKQKFLRIVSNGPVIGAGPGTYLMQITMPFFFMNPERGDTDDVYASTFELAGSYESTFDSAIEVVITADISAP